MNSDNYNDLMNELRTEYLEGFSEKFIVIRKYLSDSDLYPLELEFHKLKGTGTTYGAPEVSEIGLHMERICKSQPQDLAEWVEMAIQLLEKTKKKYLDEESFELQMDPAFKKLSQAS
ncbi:MAG: Hpt domain-containing protein [Bdellovibrionales bacterium]|nr:Hpt domain-containing protein [Bdellovibrionales bacterium]